MHPAHPRRRRARALAIVCTAVLAMALSAGSASSAEPQSLTIDPQGGAQMNTWRVGSANQAAVISSMPYAMLGVESVTLGDFQAIDGCGSQAQELMLYVREHPDQADPDASSQVAYALEAKPVPALQEGKITWRIPPTDLLPGRGYSFTVGTTDSDMCREIRQTSWTRGPVDGGHDPCRSGPIIATSSFNSGGPSNRRMWAGAGNVPGCDDNHDNDGSMGGWVVSIPTREWSLLVSMYLPGATLPSGWNPCRDKGGSDLRQFGAFVAEYQFGDDAVNEYCRWDNGKWAPLGQQAADGWHYGLPWWNGQPQDMYVRLGDAPPPPMTDQELAYKFRPALHFDNSERFRPVRLDTFFGETDPETGAPYHEVCPPVAHGRARCVPIASADALQSLSPAGGQIDIHGKVAQSGSYHSPYDRCNQGGLSDCDSGTESAAYYNVTTREPSKYRYLDYWYFYRFNQFSKQILFNHEGDWEGMTVAVAPVARPLTFDFASFSQHGHWYSYLRGNLQCGGGDKGSCGSDEARSGERVDAFVANGSHANYANPCRELLTDLPGPPGPIGKPCFQTNSVVPERGHDGTKPWGNNEAAPDVALAALPGSGSWSYWGGKWGVDGVTGNAATPGGPNSPSNQGGHLQNPWGHRCADEPCEFSPKLNPDVWKGRSPANVAAPSCDGWFGGTVAATVCSPGRLRAAVKAGGVAASQGPRTAPAVFVKGPGRRDRAATGRGIAQLAAAPLRRGDKLVLRGAATSGSQVLVRAIDGRHLVEAKFDAAALAKVAGAKVSVRGRGPSLHLALTRADGGTRKPAVLRRYLIR